MTWFPYNAYNRHVTFVKIISSHPHNYIGKFFLNLDGDWALEIGSNSAGKCFNLLLWLFPISQQLCLDQLVALPVTLCFLRIYYVTTSYLSSAWLPSLRGILRVLSEAQRLEGLPLCSGELSLASVWPQHSSLPWAEVPTCGKNPEGLLGGGRRWASSGQPLPWLTSGGAVGHAQFLQLCPPTARVSPITGRGVEMESRRC